jgi:hypothetical protein
MLLSLEDETRGASSHLISTLPVYMFKEKDDEKKEETDIQEEVKKQGDQEVEESSPQMKKNLYKCFICLDSFCKGEKIKILPCFHQVFMISNSYS